MIREKLYVIFLVYLFVFDRPAFAENHSSKNVSAKESTIKSLECQHDKAPSETTLMQILHQTGLLAADIELRNIRLLVVSLDGSPGGQVVLAADIMDAKKAGACNGGGNVGSRLWVFVREGETWKPLTSHDWELDNCWEGTIEGEPGFKVVRAEPLLGNCIDLLHVEHLSLRGSADPRYVIRSFELFSLKDNHLVSVFRCPVEDRLIKGPQRESSNIIRTIHFQGTQYPREIRVTHRESFDLSSDSPMKKGISAGALYQFREKEYVSKGKDVCSGVAAGSDPDT